MEDLNDIFKEPEEGQGIVIGNSRWCVRDGRASCVYIPDDKSEEHKNYFENMSREDLIDALECGANNIKLLQDERDEAQDRCKELENGLKDIHKYIDEIIPCIHDEELLDDIIEIIHKVVQIEPKELSEAEHAEIKRKLEEKYLGKRTPDDTLIERVFVDYRRHEQCMNRVTDEYGNVYFIEELEGKND